MPAPVVAVGPEDAVLGGDDELEALARIRVEDLSAPHQPPAARLVAVADEHPVVSELLVVIGRVLLRARDEVRHGELADVRDAHTADDEVRAHANLLHRVELEVRIGPDAARHPVHRLPVRDLVAQDRLELPLRELPVAAVLLHNVMQTEVVVRADEEVLLVVHIGLRRRQHEVHHPHRDGDLAHRTFYFFTFTFYLNHPPVNPCRRVLRRMDRQEELLALALAEGDRLQGLRVAEAPLHRQEAAREPVVLEDALVHLPRRIEPVLVPPPVRLDEPRVVRLLLRVDPDEVLVVHKQLWTEPDARIAEVAPPSVAVLIPDLDELEVQRRRRQGLSPLVPEFGQLEARLAEITVCDDDERTRLVLLLRHHDAHDAALLAVRRVFVRQLRLAAHRGHRPPRHPRLRRQSGQRKRHRHHFLHLIEPPYSTKISRPADWLS